MKPDNRLSIVLYKPVGVLTTPWKDNAPFQPSEDTGQTCSIKIFPEYCSALKNLDSFSHIIVLFHCDRVGRQTEHEENEGKISKWSAFPPWLKDRCVGTFSSRSPVRPNPIGMSIVRLISISDDTLTVSMMDAFDGSPVLDIKPYIPDIDSRPEATEGWLEEEDSRDHLLLHIRGIAHRH